MTTPAGRLVLPADVMEAASPGPVALIMDCPSPSYLPALLADATLRRCQEIGALGMKGPACTWPEVYNTSEDRNQDIFAGSHINIVCTWIGGIEGNGSKPRCTAPPEFVDVLGGWYTFFYCCLHVVGSKPLWLT